MSTLIAFGTKHGFTEKCAKDLAERLSDDVTTINLSSGAAENLDKYDTVIIGGSIYAGKIQKEVLEFCSRNLTQLLQKRIGLFVCCADKSRWEEQLNSVFPDELVARAAVKGHFGYELDPAKASFLMRFVIKALKKKVEYPAGIYYEHIAEFASKISQ